MNNSDEPRNELEEGTALTPRYNEQGLIPVICNDAETGDVLMFAWMNAEALAVSIETGTACYWSRSRGKLWRKGETSGNAQEIVEMRTDCDQDVIWIRVKQQGGAACHTGRKSCFYRSITVRMADAPNPEMKFTDAKRLFNPEDIYGG